MAILDLTITLALSAGFVIAGLACGAARSQAPGGTDGREAERRRMVDAHLRARDIRDPRVLAAMASVPRHRFVPDALQRDAYADMPLPIGHGQTISQPYIVAFMTQALEIEPHHRVLEIGTGSGYQAAVLGEVAAQVYSIEIVEPLALSASATLAALGYRNIEVRAGNGYLGWPEQAPFDRIIVTAAPDAVPPALVEQLKVGGLMAIPVGVGEQELQVLRRTDEGLRLIDRLPVRFVPMTGKPDGSPNPR